jgi:hypothetical protein
LFVGFSNVGTPRIRCFLSPDRPFRCSPGWQAAGKVSPIDTCNPNHPGPLRRPAHEIFLHDCILCGTFSSLSDTVRKPEEEENSHA